MVPLRGRSRLSEARAYTPRGSTIREAAQRAAGQEGVRPETRPSRDSDVSTPRATGRRSADEPTRRAGKPADPPRGRSRAADADRRSRDDADRPTRRRAEPDPPARRRTAADPDARRRTAADPDARRRTAADPDAPARRRAAADGQGRRRTAAEEPPARRRPARDDEASPRRRTAASDDAPRRRPTAAGTADADRTAASDDAPPRRRPAKDAEASPRRRTARETDAAPRRKTSAGRASSGRTSAGRTSSAFRSGAPASTLKDSLSNRTPPRRPKTATGPRPPRRPRRIRVPRLGNPARRLRFATAVILLLFAVLAGRLVQIQASDGAAYAARAAEGRMTAPITLVAPRGAIVDRAGNPLARSVAAVSVDADPLHVKDPVRTAKALTGLLGVTESVLVPKLSPKKNAAGLPVRFEYLSRRLDPEVGQAVSALKLAGINVRDEQRRDVPDHDTAANMIGFTGWDGGGLAGIEASYDDVLRGTDGSRQYEIGKDGQEIPDGFKKETSAKPGRDVMLTIDRDLQYETLTMLSAKLKSIGAYNGTAIVLDVKTGEILAMASYPTFDAAKPGTSNAKNRLDFATGSVIEPGSVHKAITLSAALQEGTVKPNSTVHIGPTIEKGKVTFRDTHKHGVVDITLQGILAQSSNVGTITIADRLGAQKLYEYQLKFGLGRKTGLGLPGESAGLVQPPQRWSGPSYGSIPIGLGVAVTPLQMTSVYATIANDGIRVTPTLVKGTMDGDGKLIRRPAPRTERVLSAANAQALRLDLEAVATKYGTGKKAAIENVRVAGKTGTGKRTQNSKYLPGSVSSFIGMVPADAPRYVVGIFAHGPGESGAKVAAPAFADLASFTLRYYGVAPTGTVPPPIRIYGG